MSHVQSGLTYKKEYEDTKNKHNASLDMMMLSHAKKAQDMATDINYRTYLHEYTTMPTDMKVQWAKNAYNLQSDVSQDKTNPAISLLKLHFPSCSISITF